MKALPGVEGDQVGADPTLAASNVYTVSEGILLKWLAYHYSKVRAPSPPLKLMRFDDDLRDCTVLAAAVISHVPSTAAKLNTVRIERARSLILTDVFCS